MNHLVNWFKEEFVNVLTVFLLAVFFAEFLLVVSVPVNPVLALALMGILAFVVGFRLPWGKGKVTLPWKWLVFLWLTAMLLILPASQVYMTLNFLSQLALTTAVFLAMAALGMCADEIFGHEVDQFIDQLMGSKKSNS